MTKPNSARFGQSPLVLSVLVAAAPAEAQRPAAASVDGIVQRFSIPGGPGCAMALSKEGKQLINRAFGLASLEHEVPNTPATVFEAGSASKQFTAAAILLLAREGKLSLGDDIRKYVPEMPDYGPPITIDHLLKNTSGLRDWRFVYALAGWVPGTRVESNVNALDAARRQRGLNHAPGAEYSYTNTGYTLAAAIVERVTGKSHAAFTKERLFTPLGMTSTQWRDDFRRIVKDRATGYKASGAGWVQDMPFENSYGHGGLQTTVGDLLIWNEALESDAPGRGIATQLQEQAVLTSGDKVGYARGLYVDRHRGTVEVGHGGVANGFYSWTGRYPEHKIAVAVLCNSGTNPAQLARALVDLHLPPAMAAFPARTESMASSFKPASGTTPAPARDSWSPTRAELSEFAGRYTSDEAGATYIAAVENGQLTLRVDRWPDRMLVLGPTFKDMFVFPLGSARFTRDAKGKVADVLLKSERASLVFRRE